MLAFASSNGIQVFYGIGCLIKKVIIGYGNTLQDICLYRARGLIKVLSVNPKTNKCLELKIQLARFIRAQKFLSYAWSFFVSFSLPFLWARKSLFMPRLKPVCWSVYQEKFKCCRLKKSSSLYGNQDISS